MADIRQTKEYANYLQQTGWIVETIGGVNYFIRKFPLMGAVIKIQRPRRIDLEAINQLSERYKAFQVIIEPNLIRHTKLLIAHGYKLSKSPYIPSKTLVTDLTQSREKILDRMKNDARSAIKKRIKLPTQTLNNKLEKFRNRWKGAVGWKRYITPLKNLKALENSFDEKSLFLATKNAGAIFLVGDNTAYYWQAFTNSQGRKNLEQYKVVWEGILWAKKRGARNFDFEGIYDERFPNKDWLGFTHFKKSFGGKGIEHPGAFVKTRLPI